MNRNIKHLNLRHLSVGAMAVALLLPVAHSQTKGAMPAMQGGMAASSAMPGKGMDMQSTMKDMNGKMGSMPMSGNPDVDFATMMRIHHQGAIDMANVELSTGKDPQMKKMAKAIIAAQKKEIAAFDAFLSKQENSTMKMNK